MKTINRLLKQWSEAERAKCRPKQPSNPNNVSEYLVRLNGTYKLVDPQNPDDHPTIIAAIKEAARARDLYFNYSYFSATTMHEANVYTAESHGTGRSQMHEAEAWLHAYTRCLHHLNTFNRAARFN